MSEEEIHDYPLCEQCGKEEPLENGLCPDCDYDRLVDYKESMRDAYD